MLRLAVLSAFVLALAVACGEEAKQALDGGGYTVTKDEHEEVDAEANFSGGNSTGQVKLVQECRDRTSVTITARPA